MLLSELLRDTDAEILFGDKNIPVTGIAMDSRNVKDGCVFVCIEGAVCDGHEFIREALERGASAVAVNRGREQKALESEGVGEATGKRYFTAVSAEDTRSLLAHMAAVWFGYPERKLITIGITGTKGKTTTSYLIKSILENAGRRVGLIGTNEVIIGRKHVNAGNTTPDTLLLHQYFREMLEEGLDTVVMEVSSQALKLKRVEGILFDYGIFTNLSPDHIAPAEHRDFQEYLSCKRKLFQQCRVGLINGDDPYAAEVTEDCTCALETFGLGDGCMLRGENILCEMQEGKLGVSFRVTGQMDFSAYLPLPGRFSVYNALAGIGICRHFHVRESDIQRSLLAAKVKGRIESVPGTKGYAVLIDYAHNPMALESLLVALREYRPGRLICMFGCGGNRPIMRRRRMGLVSGRLADLTVITDDNPRDEEPGAIREQIREGVAETGGEYTVIPNRRDAIKYCLSVARAQDIIVLAGKGHETFQEIRGVMYPMDEREIVQEILRYEDTVCGGDC